MGTPKNESVEEKEYIKNVLKKREEEEIDKAIEVFKSIEKDLNSIKDIQDWKRDAILRKIHDYADYKLSAFSLFMRSKNVD